MGRIVLGDRVRHAHAFLIQSSRTALVNGHSNIDERLVRWLLMVQDRVGLASAPNCSEPLQAAELVP